MNISLVDLESSQEAPKFIEPYRYGWHREVDALSKGKSTICKEYYGETDDSKFTYYSATTIGDWLIYYDPDIVQPSENVMNRMKFKVNGGSESIKGYAVHTVTCLLGQKEIQDKIKGSTVVDLGAGSGIQALASLVLGAKHVILYENNEEAIAMAKELMKLNGFGKDRYTIIADTLENIALYAQIFTQADIGIANIGQWEQYHGAENKAVKVLDYALNMKYYIAGGYGYDYFGPANDR